MYILIDKNNIIRCMASEEVNLHKDKLHMNKLNIEDSGFIVGDEYDPKTKEVIKHPENYPLDKEQIKEKKIQDEIRKIAIQNLKNSGDNDFI